MVNGSPARRARAARIMLAGVAMLVSGCFNAGPSVKQAMTSAAIPSADGSGSPTAASTTAAAAAQGVPSAESGTPIAATRSGTAAARAPSSGTATPGAAVQFDLHKPEVETKVVVFQNRLRGFFDRALSRSGRYVPTMADILVREGLPAELAYLPLIESGYQPEAVSRAGAVGPWQFIYETGRRYGLRIDSMVDERRDPIKSTHAAVQYLKDLHGMFGDWELSLAAYNSGENRVARILASTSADDFWDMRDRGYLPDETSEYVPRFLAAVRIASAPEHYGFDTPDEPPLRFETVHVDRQLSLRTAAGVCGVPPARLAELNPALRRGVMPSGYALRVPAGTAEPLRSALANGIEPARPARRIAAAGRKSARRAVARSSGSRARQVARRTADPPSREAAVAQPPRRADARRAGGAPPNRRAALKRPLRTAKAPTLRRAQPPRGGDRGRAQRSSKPASSQR